ncbi:MAG: hypothetical protein LBR29_05535 [Methylobacteriaceae bacterium]|jgi:endogenous inhibitor of DNA gyrase (YacG/DUF329 family)|nr:hypothetical protein [Methylobacteriaceae bacterium]
MFDDLVLKPDTCPICGKVAEGDFAPYCSAFCSERDPSGLWFRENQNELTDDTDTRELEWPGAVNALIADSIERDDEIGGEDVFAHVIERVRF